MGREHEAAHPTFCFLRFFRVGSSLGRRNHKWSIRFSCRPTLLFFAEYYVFVVDSPFVVLTPNKMRWEQVVVLRCDVTVGDDVSSALAAAASSEAGLPPVRGIVHAACPPQAGEGGEDREGAPWGVQQRFLGAKVRGFNLLSNLDL